MDGCGDRRGPARRRHRRDRRGVAGRDRLRLRERDGRVRPAVRARARAGAARAADHLAAEQHEGADRAEGRHGVRTGDVLSGERRVLRRADRGGGRGDRGRAADSHPLPGAGSGRRQPLLGVAMETDLFIGGKWVPAASRFDVLDPATGDAIASVSDGSVEDALTAVEAASAAFGSWAAAPPRQRSEILRRAFELMTARADDLAKLISLENGKALTDAK